MIPSDREPPITPRWQATPLPYNDEPDLLEEYVEVGEPTCDECGTELEAGLEGSFMCEVCGKHFTERG